MINSMQLFFIVLAITIGMASGFPITPTEESTVGSPLETNTPANSHRKVHGRLAFHEDYLEQDSSREKLQDIQQLGEKPQAVPQSNEKLRTRQQLRQKLQDRQRSGEKLPANQETDAVPEQSPSPADLQVVPMWLLSLIVVAASGIFVVLLVGCAFCILTCLKRRSKSSGIDPMLEAVIIDNKQLQDEQTHFYFPSRKEMKQLVREAFEEE